MLFSVNWLKKWVDIDLPVDELAGKLTASGLEVDTFKPVAAHFSDVVVADGIIQSCSYYTKCKIIIIPEILDGQTVLGIADKYDGVFYDVFHGGVSLLLKIVLIHRL